MKKVIGVDLGGTNIKSAIVDEKGNIIKNVTIPTFAERGYKLVVEQIEKAISMLISDEIDGIGIGSPGIVSAEKGTISYPPNFPGWKVVNMKKILEAKFNKPVFVENDANAAAIGEYIYGQKMKKPNFIMVTLGTGVGGGIFYKGELMRGETGGAGEVGHISIDYKGEKCNCGSTGCIEAYAGNQKIIYSVNNKIKTHSESKVFELLGNDLTGLEPKVLFEAAKLGDEFSIKAIAEIGEYLGYGLSNAVNLLDIATIIVGGGVSGFGDFILNPMENIIKSRVMKSIQPRVKVMRSKLGNEAGVKGAASLVKYFN